VRSVRRSQAASAIKELLDLHHYACLGPILMAMIRIENRRQPYTHRLIDWQWSALGLCRPSCSRPSRMLADYQVMG
jgi:hypothetical protein